jgi:hypothetical protein
MGKFYNKSQKYFEKVLDKRIDEIANKILPERNREINKYLDSFYTKNFPNVKDKSILLQLTKKHFNKENLSNNDFKKWLYDKNPKGEIARIDASCFRVEQFYSPFLLSKDWIELKTKVLNHYGRKCMKCGIKNTELHVDHIKPRSKFPELSLVFENLQVLCKCCNQIKSDKDFTDYRPK